MTAEIADGACDDSFRIQIGDQILYEYWAVDDGGQLLNLHQVDIPATLIPADGNLTVNFKNTSRDSYGLAGVFKIWLEADESA